MARFGMLIDLTLCMGCGACMVACKTEHQIPTGKHNGHEYYRIGPLKYEMGKYPAVKRGYLPMFCMQCEKAPCIDICPIKGALYRRDDGVIIIDKDKCDGCKLCIQACPYKALYFNEEKLVVDKCDFCAERLEQGLEPACVTACLGKAIIFGDFDDSSSKVSRRVVKKNVKGGSPLLPSYFNKAFKPSVYYIEPKKSDSEMQG